VVIAREREVAAREVAVIESETRYSVALAEKDTEISSLRALLSAAEAIHQQKVREALMKREEELRTMVLKQEAEVAVRMAKREEEIMEAVRTREEDIAAMWANWEKETREGMCRAVEERMNWVKERTEELDKEKQSLESVRKEMERKMEEMERRIDLASSKPMKTYHPLEEVKNIIAPLRRMTAEQELKTPVRPTKSNKPPVFETPISKNEAVEMPSAMKGVVLTSTGEALATPGPTEVAKLFLQTPKVNLNFSQIFDFDSETESDSVGEDGYETDTRPAALSTIVRAHSKPSPELAHDDLESTPTQATVRPTRLRRPSISQRPSLEVLPSITAPTASTSSIGSGPAIAFSIQPKTGAKTRTRPPTSTGLRSGSTTSSKAIEYDISDEENLPSPFLKRVDRERLTRTVSVPTAAIGQDIRSSSSKLTATSNNHSARTRAVASRKSGVGTLRTVAVVNAANAAACGPIATSKNMGTQSRPLSRTQSASAVHLASGNMRSSIVKAQRASAEARRALSRS
jgi:NIMA (never in mitosis gene a)-related kinase 2